MSASDATDMRLKPPKHVHHTESLSHEAIRLKCLELAATLGAGEADILALAERLVAWCTKPPS